MEREPSSASERGDEESRRIDASWLMKLRWGAVAGQLLTIAYVERFMGIDLPSAPLFAIVGVEVASNGVFFGWLRRASRVGEGLIAGIIAADVLLLTALLYFTGGPMNPFSSLYLVHIALAAVVLQARFTWMLFALSVACLGLLFVLEPPSPLSHAQHMVMHLRGMWVAMGVAGALIGYFVTRVGRDLARARSVAARTERIAALGTLAAGAAHEISTPLSTILVVTRELERALERSGGDDVLADVRLIRGEVERCRSVLERMAAEVGETHGEAFAWIDVERLVDAAAEGACPRARLRVSVVPRPDARVYGPRLALAQALGAVLKNADQVTPPDRHVELRVRGDGAACTIEVEDSGEGMTLDVAARAGEPFFTTKEPGHGMGLGLFLARAVVERLGGTVQIESERGRGTLVRLTLPDGRSRAGAPT